MGTRNRWPSGRLTALTVVATLLAAACSGSDGVTTEPSVPASAPPPESAAPDTTAPSTTVAVDTTASDTTPPNTTAAPTTAPEALPTGTFSALAYNIAGLPDVLSGSNPDVNTAIIGDRINAFDLVLIQESWLTPDPNPTDLRTYHEEVLATSTLPFISESLPAPLNTDPDRPEASLSDGLNRFANLEFEPVVRQRWTNCGDDDADCLALKGFSMARTTVAPGITIDVYNLHMEAGDTDEALRGENVEQLATFIEDNSAESAVIVGGDFNLKLDREVDAAQFATLLERAGLTDVCTELDCPEPFRIDKFVYRSSLELELTPVTWSNADADFRRDDGEPLSDHDPVVVDFEWTAVAPTDI